MREKDVLESDEHESQENNIAIQDLFNEPQGNM